MAYRKYDPHQVTAAAIVRRLRGSAGLFLAPGTGKTIVAIRTAVTPALVICRRDDFLTWRMELEAEGYPEHSRIEIDFAVRGGYLNDLLSVGVDLDVEWVMVTYDLMKNPSVAAWVNCQAFNTVICDESQAIKGHKSKRTKAVITATRHIPRRVAMSGSAIGNDPLDLFSQVLFIDNGKTFGTNQWAFRSKYYIKSGPGWYRKRDAPAKISEKLKAISYYVHEDDVLRLPPVRKVLKAVPMNPKQQATYNRAITDWEIDLQDNGTLEMDHVIVRLAKLRQIASGFFYWYPDNDNTQPRETTWVSHNKIDLLIDLLQNDALKHKQKVVIASAHTAEIEAIAQRLESQRIASCYHYGGMSGKQRECARRSFKNDPDVRLFVANADMLVGMNELTVADTMVYMSNSQKALSRQQSQRRIRRKGSEHHKVITYWDVVSEGTIEVALVQSIGAMMSLAHSILSGLHEGRLLRDLL